MRTPLLMVVLGLALAGGANAVAVADPVPAPPAVHAVSEPVIVGTDGNGGTTNLSVGEELAVALPDTPSTGYVWEIGQIDRGVLAQEGDPVFRPGTMMPGSPGTSVWTFTAAKAGSTHLELVSVRPWDRANPAQRFSMTVAVK
ncbi:protease inhibitor I42 family protein [Nocardia vermiculata]|uniref:Protease inhibitor I42 family protein n=1 Tax=Nocardia vermiculata TaxID=257274 RepID=A0A846Y8K4_9NOCA|nr:protease inhibitor I42 family protein [Nocardia vermiculata]NKY54134.1 protease inhibitor I42 family protein [Nocardia vermiculata]